MEPVKVPVNARNATENGVVMNHGGIPPQPHVPQRARYRQDDMLLYAAWAHGMTGEDIAHRYALFAFVQSHVGRKSEEALQRTIETNCSEKNASWTPLGDGRYKLTRFGTALLSNFGSRPAKVSLSAKYLFSAQFNGHAYSVLVDPARRCLKVYVDRERHKGVDVVSMLKRQNVLFWTESNSGPLKVLNWIISGTEFTWERHP
jgi:hypothetical protein